MNAAADLEPPLAGLPRTRLHRARYRNEPHLSAVSTAEITSSNGPSPLVQTLPPGTLGVTFASWTKRPEPARRRAGLREGGSAPTGTEEGAGRPQLAVGGPAGPLPRVCAASCRPGVPGPAEPPTLQVSRIRARRHQGPGRRPAPQWTAEARSIRGPAQPDRRVTPGRDYLTRYKAEWAIHFIATPAYGDPPPEANGAGQGLEHSRGGSQMDSPQSGLRQRPERGRPPLRRVRNDLGLRPPRLATVARLGRPVVVVPRPRAAALGSGVRPPSRRMPVSSAPITSAPASPVVTTSSTGSSAAAASAYQPASEPWLTGAPMSSASSSPVRASGRCWPASR